MSFRAFAILFLFTSPPARAEVSYLDLTGETERQIIVDREAGQ